VKTPCPNPSQTAWYSIYLPRRDGRLSLPNLALVVVVVVVVILLLVGTTCSEKG